MWRSLLLCAVALLSSCAAPWARDRALDLADCFSGSVAAGLELSADVQATDLLHLGVGGGVHAEAGFVGRRYGTAALMTLGLPFAPLLEQVGYGRLAFEHGGTWGLAEVQDECYVVHALALPPTNPERSALDAFDLEVGAIALIGGRVGVRPGQLVDFLAGLVGFDPAGDDARAAE